MERPGKTLCCDLSRQCRWNFARRAGSDAAAAARRLEVTRPRWYSGRAHHHHILNTLLPPLPRSSPPHLVTGYHLYDQATLVLQAAPASPCMTKHDWWYMAEPRVTGNTGITGHTGGTGEAVVGVEVGLDRVVTD